MEVSHKGQLVCVIYTFHFVQLFFLPATWNVDVITGARAAILDHEVTLEIEAISH